MSIDQNYLVTDPKWIKILRQWEEIEKKCTNCGVLFKEINNIGQWKCMGHTRDWNDIGNGLNYGPNKWDCCGSTNRKKMNGVMYPNGCTRCDHTTLSSRLTNIDDIPLPVVLYSAVNPKSESILSEKELPKDKKNTQTITSYIFVRRYDWKR